MSEELDLTNVKKFRMELKRTTMKDHPLAPGSTAICFTEDPEGKPFSELTAEILQDDTIAKAAFKKDVFMLRYWINVEITSEATMKDVQDIRYGLAILDEPATEYRIGLQTDPKAQIKEQARRLAANVHVVGLFNTAEYLQEFDTCCLDMSGLDADEIEKNLVFVAVAAQRINPTVYIIPTELANKLSGPDFKDTAFAKIMNPKVTMKSVFADGKDLTNAFVRAI